MTTFVSAFQRKTEKTAKEPEIKLACRKI